MFVTAKQQRHGWWRNVGLTLLVALVAIPAGLGYVGLGGGSGSARPGVANNAHGLIFWVGCGEIVALSDRELDTWKRRGVDGFACGFRYLAGMGGDQYFTGDPRADLAGSRYRLQRRLRDSEIGRRAAERGMKLYLGFYLANHWNTATPLKEWFDDVGWSRKVLPEIHDVAGAARRLGFAGLAFDQELYPQVGGAADATWSWDYPGRRHDEAAVRAAAKRRGQQLMRAMVGAFPGIEILAYDTKFPETWDELVQKEVNETDNSRAHYLHINFWDGLSSVEGYRAIRWLNATFYKTPHVRGSTWDTALEYHYNSLFSMLSRRFSNWAYASSRVYESPFIWIDSGPSHFERARPPECVADQLRAFSLWGMGGEFANYAYVAIKDFDYAPYAAGMRVASRPAVVDRQPPQLEVNHDRRGPSLDLWGWARDNLAIRVVRWKSDRGGAGVAKLRWRVNSGSYDTGWDWQMNWRIGGVPLRTGANRVEVEVEDIKGLTTTRTLEVTAGSGPPRARTDEQGGAAHATQAADRSALGSKPILIRSSAQLSAQVCG